MLNTLVEDTLGIIQQAYEWKTNNGIVNTLVYSPKFIEFLLNNNLGDNPTTFQVENIALSEDIENFDKTREKIKDSIILLFSGGLDSFIAYHMLREAPDKNLTCLFVNLHTSYSDKELKAVKELSFKVRMKVLFQDCDLRKWMTDEWGYTIPVRNLLLTAIGSYFSDEIYLISQKGETEIADRTPRFFKESSKEFSEFYGESIKVGKVINKTKQDMVRWYIRKGYNPDLLKETVSCFERTESSKIHCGRCPSCVRKAVALAYNGIDISDMFENDITKSELIPKYIEKMKKGLYDKRRTIQTLKVFKKWGWKI